MIPCSKIGEICGLADYPWIDYDTVIQKQAAAPRPTLTDNVLDILYQQTGKQVKTVIRTSPVDLSLMETGPYLSVLSLDFMKMLPGSFLKPLRLQLGNYRFPAGVLSRKSSSNMSHCRDFINIIRDIVLGRVPAEKG